MLSAVIPSAHSYPAMRLAPQQVHHRCVRPGPLVLRATHLNTPTPTVDRDQTVSRRFEPNSRTTLIGEQTNPWYQLQHQDVMSRHRGAKRPRRLELSGIISLLSPAYLLSVKRRTYLSDSSDHYSRLSSLVDPSIGQSSKFMLLDYHLRRSPQ